MGIRFELRKLRMKLSDFSRSRYIWVLIALGFVLVVVGSAVSCAINTSRLEEMGGIKLSKCQENVTSYRSEVASCLDDLEATTKSYDMCQKNVTSLSMELSTCLIEVSSSLSECLEDKQALQNENKDLTNSLAGCKVSLANINTSLVILQNRLNECEENITNIIAVHGLLVKNAANDICCVRRAVYPALNLTYYYVENNTILCTSEYNETLDTKEFSCA